MIVSTQHTGASRSYSSSVSRTALIAVSMSGATIWRARFVPVAHVCHRQLVKKHRLFHFQFPFDSGCEQGGSGVPPEAGGL